MSDINGFGNSSSNTDTSDTDGESGSVEEQYRNVATNMEPYQDEPLASSDDETIDDNEEDIDGIPLEAIASRVKGWTAVNEW